jgi:hypothetical protein
MNTALKTLNINAEQAELIFRPENNTNNAFERTLSRAVYIEITE